MLHINSCLFILSIFLCALTMVYCHLDVSVKERNFTFSQNLTPKKSLIDPSFLIQSSYIQDPPLLPLKYDVLQVIITAILTVEFEKLHIRGCIMWRALVTCDPAPLLNLYSMKYY